MSSIRYDPRSTRWVNVMREHTKRDWLNVKKRLWSKPQVEEIPLSDDVARLLQSRHPTSAALDRLIKSRSSTT